MLLTSQLLKSKAMFEVVFSPKLENMFSALVPLPNSQLSNSKVILADLVAAESNIILTFCELFSFQLFSFIEKFVAD